MSLSAHPLRGPLFMVLATGSYVINDSLMKVATEALPPYQVLVLRGLAATLWGMPLLLILGYRRNMPQLLEPRVLARNLCETFGVMCFVVALANMPIADATALGQITPLVLLLGAAFFFGERIGGLSLALIGCGFIGALMVAQPTGAGISVYALLGLANAVICAVRDLVGRRVPGHIPGLIVAISAVLVVLAGASTAHLLTETWVEPSSRHLLMLLASGLFLIFGHFFIFMAYRVGPTRSVAPFYYCFTVWAVISGFVVFGHLPNMLASLGILLVVASGLAIVLLDQRRRRPAPST
jgi:drug/metabolite transporter (DMT)-like permease